MRGGAVLTNAVCVRPAARQEADPARYAQGSAGIRTMKTHARFGETIERRHSIKRESRTLCDTGMVLVDHDNEEIRPVRRGCGSGSGLSAFDCPRSDSRKTSQTEELSAIPFAHLLSLVRHKHSLALVALGTEPRPRGSGHKADEPKSLLVPQRDHWIDARSAI